MFYFKTESERTLNFAEEDVEDELHMSVSTFVHLEVLKDIGLHTKQDVIIRCFEPLTFDSLNLQSVFLIAVFFRFRRSIETWNSSFDVPDSWSVGRLGDMVAMSCEL